MHPNERTPLIPEELDPTSPSQSIPPMATRATSNPSGSMQTPMKQHGDYFSSRHSPSQHTPSHTPTYFVSSHHRHEPRSQHHEHEPGLKIRERKASLSVVSRPGLKVDELGGDVLTCEGEGRGRGTGDVHRDGVTNIGRKRQIVGILVCLRVFLLLFLLPTGKTRYYK
jgi:hypothetical protein